MSKAPTATSRANLPFNIPSCPNCGNPIEIDKKFCRKCGFYVESYAKQIERDTLITPLLILQAPIRMLETTSLISSNPSAVAKEVRDYMDKLGNIIATAGNSGVDSLRYQSLIKPLEDSLVNAWSNSIAKQERINDNAKEFLLRITMLYGEMKFLEGFTARGSTNKIESSVRDWINKYDQFSHYISSSQIDAQTIADAGQMISEITSGLRTVRENLSKKSGLYYLIPSIVSAIAFFAVRLLVHP